MSRWGPPPSSSSSNFTLRVSNLPVRITESGLKEHFSRSNVYLAHVTINRPVSGKPFATITVRDDRSRDLALRLDNTSISNCSITVRSESNCSTVSVELSNLPDNLSEAQIASLCSHCGPIVGVSKATPRTAIVLFTNNDSARMCIDSLDDVVCATGLPALSVKLHQASNSSNLAILKVDTVADSLGPGAKDSAKEFRTHFTRFSKWKQVQDLEFNLDSAEDKLHVLTSACIKSNIELRRTLVEEELAESKVRMLDEQLKSFTV